MLNVRSFHHKLMMPLVEGLGWFALHLMHHIGAFKMQEVIVKPMCSGK
jgi:hypothetical protein